jgi:hypothetical protein
MTGSAVQGTGNSCRNVVGNFWKSAIQTLGCICARMAGSASSHKTRMDKRIFSHAFIRASCTGRRAEVGRPHAIVCRVAYTAINSADGDVLRIRRRSGCSRSIVARNAGGSCVAISCRVRRSACPQESGTIGTSGTSIGVARDTVGGCGRMTC